MTTLPSGEGAVVPAPVPTHAIVGNATLYHADCRDVLRSLPDNSIDSVVTDPPYALVSIQKRFANSPRSATTENPANPYGRTGRGFMGQRWDNGETAFSEEFWAEVLRVLKPGGHVVAFSGTRTYHRMAVAIEDAGFEIRDRIRFDQSFDTKFGPLVDSLNDEQRGMLLELLNDYVDGGSEVAWTYGSGFPKSHNQKGEWQGWGTALKPAWEPICLARKPLVGTVAENVLQHGTGALNIDGCRVATSDTYSYPNGPGGCKGGEFHYQGRAGTPAESNPLGRWPANIVHDGSDEVLAAFPHTKSGGFAAGTVQKATNGASFGKETERVRDAREPDSGSAARFFYAAKASRKDRDEGLEHLPKQAGGMVSNTSGQHITRRDEGYKPEPRANTHPTVKPTSLMSYLCRLVTPPGGVILDPFMGSGSTGKAALLEGFRFIGCEREDEYMPIAEARIAAALRRTANDNQPVAAPAAVAANSNQPDLFGSAA